MTLTYTKVGIMVYENSAAIARVKITINKASVSNLSGKNDAQNEKIEES